MDEYIDILIANMKVLSSVPNGGRLAVRRGQLSVDTTVHGQFLARFWHGDSRESTLQHVKNTVAGVVRASEGIMASTSGRNRTWKDMWTLRHLSSEMQRAEFGLRNLRTTYTDDAGTIASLQVISERLQAHRETIDRFVGSGPGPEEDCGDATPVEAANREGSHSSAFV
jgi:hypothetical protein